MKRRTLLKAAAAFPVTLLSGCAVYDDGLYGGYYETGVPTGTSAPWASPSRGSADDASVWRSAPDRSWQTGTGFPESSRTPRRARDGSPPGVWSSSGSAPRSAPKGPHGPGEPPPGFPR